jgi:hypothetical protein
MEVLVHLVQLQTERRHENGVYIAMIGSGGEIGGVDPLKYVVVVVRGGVLVELYLVDEFRKFPPREAHVGAQLRVKGLKFFFVAV